MIRTTEKIDIVKGAIKGVITPLLNGQYKVEVYEYEHKKDTTYKNTETEARMYCKRYTTDCGFMFC